MASCYEVQMAGTGGQGLALAGLILAEAAGIYDDKNVAYTEQHGVASRGGNSRSEVIISDEEIDYPFVERPSLLLALTQETCDSLSGRVQEGGTVIVDEDLVQHLPEGSGTIYRLPFVRTAREKLGRPIVANILALAAIAVISKVVSLGALEKAVDARSPASAGDLNRRALEVGIELAKAAVPAQTGPVVNAV